MDAREVRALIDRSGMTNYQVARAVGVTERTVYNWRAGSTAMRSPEHERALRDLRGRRA